MADFNDSVAQEVAELEAMKHLRGWRKKQMDIWLILDHPRSSKLALVCSQIDRHTDSPITQTYTGFSNIEISENCFIIITSYVIGIVSVIRE